MSDKDRQKKDGQDKNKKNQRRREAESNSLTKKAHSTHNRSAEDSEAYDSGEREEETATKRPAPAAARSYASKANKGK